MADAISTLLLHKRRIQLGILTVLLQKREQTNTKRRHRFWVHEILKGRIEQGAFNNLVRELELDRNKYHEYFRMSSEKMEYILGLVGPRLARRVVVREPLDAKLRLVICIRYVIDYLVARPFNNVY